VQPLMITRDHDQLGLDGGPVTARPIDLAPLVGTWVNVDERATGIGRVEIADRDGTLAVRVCGVRGPEPFDWGEVVADAFSDGVTSQAAVGFVTHYHFGFLKVLLDAHVNQRLLVVETFGTFTDSSGRPGYLRHELLVHSQSEAA
jgi:hypothetical protein